MMKPEITWTTKYPTEEGFYWVTYDSHRSQPDIVRVYIALLPRNMLPPAEGRDVMVRLMGEERMYDVHELGSELGKLLWFGPIDPPVFTRNEPAEAIHRLP